MPLSFVMTTRFRARGGRPRVGLVRTVDDVNTNIREGIMNHISRMAGAGLLVYGIGTTAGFVGAGGPGGDYDAAGVTAYFDPRHYPTAFAFWYLGALAALGLLLFGLGLRRVGGLGGMVGESLWGLAIAGTAVSVTGAFVGGGLVVAGAEGGVTVQTGVPHPVVYTISEIANLLSVCAPALFVGVIAIVLAVRAGLPRWLQIFSVVAGICGILAPFYFTLGLYLIWVLVFGTWAVVRGVRSGAGTHVPLHESLV
jgi:hypothetical protein